MQLTQWTLFIDMLGYREINGSINSEEKAKEFIEFMETNKKIFEYSDSDEIRERYKKIRHSIYINTMIFKKHSFPTHS